MKIDNLPPPLRSLGLESIGWKEIAAIATGWVGVLVYGYFVKTRLKTKLAIALLSTPAQIIYGVAGLMDSPPRTEATPIAQTTAPRTEPAPEYSLAQWDDLSYDDRYKTVVRHLNTYLAVRGINPDIPDRAKLIARILHALDTHSYSKANAQTIGQSQEIRNALNRELPDLPDIAIAGNAIAAPANTDALTLSDWRGLQPADQYAIVIATIRDHNLTQPSLDNQAAITIAYLDALDPDAIAASPDDNLVRYIVGLNEEFAAQ